MNRRFAPPAQLNGAVPSSGMDESDDWRGALAVLRHDVNESMHALERSVTASLHKFEVDVTVSLRDLEVRFSERLAKAEKDHDDRISSVEVAVAGLRSVVRLQSAVLVAVLGGLTALLWKSFVG